MHKYIYYINCKINEIESLYDLLICTYRITNKTNTIPIITGTQAPTVPPTIAGKFSDRDNRIVVVSKKRTNKLFNIIYVIYKECRSEVHPNRRYTINTLVSIFTTIQTAAFFVTRLVDTVNITLIPTYLSKRHIAC